MKINIVIPVLNEERSLEPNVIKTISFLDSTELATKYVITIADNGSTDQTPVIAQKLSNTYACIKWFRVSEKGVGLAFREAIKINCCDIIGYMDVDLATDIRHLTQVYQLFLSDKAFAVIGSRLLPKSRVYNRSLKREITSRGLNILLHIILQTKFSDAMCGFKFYKKDIAERLISECSNNNGWFFCAEMMIQAEWDNIRLTEIPIEWHDDSDSKVKIARLSANYMRDIFHLMKEKSRRKL